MFSFKASERLSDTSIQAFSFAVKREKQPTHPQQVRTSPHPSLPSREATVTPWHDRLTASSPTIPAAAQTPAPPRRAPRSQRSTSTKMYIPDANSHLHLQHQSRASPHDPRSFRSPRAVVLSPRPVIPHSTEPSRTKAVQFFLTIRCSFSARHCSILERCRSCDVTRRVLGDHRVTS